MKQWDIQWTGRSCHSPMLSQLYCAGAPNIRVFWEEEGSGQKRLAVSVSAPWYPSASSLVSQFSYVKNASEIPILPTQLQIKQNKRTYDRNGGDVLASPERSLRQFWLGCSEFKLIYTLGSHQSTSGHSDGLSWVRDNLTWLAAGLSDDVDCLEKC